MKKSAILPCLFATFVLIVPFACDDKDEVVSALEESTDPKINDSNNEDPDDGETGNGTLVSLTANADYLSNDGVGDQAWGDDIIINAFKIDGSAGRVLFETQFKDDGFGVAGGRWKQIDYYYEYQGQVVQASEQLVLRFKNPVTDVLLQVGQMDPDEGRQAKEGKTCDDGGLNRVDESGKWTAFDANETEIASGILLDEFSMEGRLPDSMGSYRFLLNTQGKAISKIVIEATQWGGNERGCPTSRSSYANEPLNDSGNTENNSEFNIMGISYKK